MIRLIFKLFVHIWINITNFLKNMFWNCAQNNITSLYLSYYYFSFSIGYVHFNCSLLISLIFFKGSHVRFSRGTKVLFIYSFYFCFEYFSFIFLLLVIFWEFLWEEGEFNLFYDYFSVFYLYASPMRKVAPAYNFIKLN